MANSILTMIDETTTGEITGKLEVAFDRPRVSVRDIIVTRVEIEVEAYNKNLSDRFNGLVRPTGAEKTLNGFKMKKKMRVDVDQQVTAALEAFEQNGFILFIDDQQVDQLNDIVEIATDTKVSFLKLTPLVGG